jgi:type I restriction enzyme M protein
VHGIGPQKVALGSQKTRVTRISQQRLESYLWGAATLLRGTIDAGDYKQFIFPLLFYKRICDVFDEETETALKESGGDKTFAAYRENHRFQVPPEAHWFEVRRTSNNVGQALQSAMRAIETANPEKLYGIFGDAQWTNKDRLSDAMLRDLVEHFSSLELTLANLPEDELGQGYEYLIKKFADDAGHTAAEFYTNRTVVHLMTEMLEPQPGESIYDPTCGSGGMLLSCITHLRRQGKEWRNVRLYGQERNLMTSSIARMNCFLHGIEDFQIVRGDTLSEPKFVEGDRLMHFDVVLANPPYSIKQWDRDAFASDPWGRNRYGTPPQSNADYAFFQHILCSLKIGSGRCAILFPHGVLFRDSEKEMRRKVLDADLIECIVGLGMNLFYNSSMPSCVVICRTMKPKTRRRKILLINAVNEVTRERTQSFLTQENLNRIVAAYSMFKDEPGFAKVVTLDGVRSQDSNLNLPLYISADTEGNGRESKLHPSLMSELDRWLSVRTNALGALAEILPKTSFNTIETHIHASNTWPLLKERSQWPRVRLGDVAEKTEEVERDPIAAGLSRYLKVEHLDADCLRISRWGNLADDNVPPTFHKVFRRKQVLYPTRRPHLRRAAFADFDGICGEKTLTLSAAAGVDPQFLPFLFQSEGFISFATNRMVGSVNPHVRWRDVAEFEFNLPKPEHQTQIAQLLWAVDELIAAGEKTLQQLKGLRDTCAAEFFSLRRERGHSSRPTGKLDELADIGPSLGVQIDDSSLVSFITMADLSETGKIEQMATKRFGDVKKGFTVFREGDVLFAKITPCMENGKGAHALELQNGIGVGSTEFHIIRPRRHGDGRFLFHLTMTPEFRSEARRFMHGSAGQQRVPAAFLRDYELIIPLPEDREAIGKELDKMAARINVLTAYCESTRRLYKYYVDTVFQATPRQ